MPGEDALALNGESLQVPAVIVGALLGAAALAHFPREVAAQRRRARKVRALLFGAGVAFGAAIAVKQSAALHPAVVAAFVVLRAGRAGRTWRGYGGEIAALAIGTLLVPAAFVAHAASRGTLGALFYYTVTYNAEVHLQPGSASHPWLTPLFVRLATGTLLPLALVVLAVGKALPFLARRVRARAPWRGWGVRAYVASHLVVATLSAASLVRFFPHYFLVALPFLALSLGAALAPIARKQPAVLAGFVVFLVGFAALTCTFREKVDGRVSHDRAVQQVAAYVQATTRPDDRIFVWGFSPWIYGYAHRRPAGRYVFATYPTGFVPWFWAPLEEERARAVPGSMQALLDDLARE